MANYDNLAPAQQDRFDALMSQPTNQWPAELIQHVRSWGGPFCGDALADAVAGWVRKEYPSADSPPRLDREGERLAAQERES